jgi:hypothetical protein
VDRLEDDQHEQHHDDDPEDHPTHRNLRGSVCSF